MRPSWLDRLFGGAVSVLLAALAVYTAARLIESVWRTLAICAAVVLTLGLLGALCSWLFRRRRGW
ncbi:hypothetical protein GCM10023225_09640 [Kineococcus glutinatus]|uniref:Uncharacterized protein n=1 Tax=Kineococcus glutinatus TaxID=1070872 RepID=A0ABP9HFA1_9ACTN